MINIFLIIFIIIFIICYFLNYSLKNENFVDIVGSHIRPDKSTFTPVNTHFTEDNRNFCNVGSQCETESGFGILNKNCECIVDGNLNKKVDKKEKIKKMDKKDTDYIPLSPYTPSDCYPNDSTNFLEICHKKYSPEYGIKEKIPCNNTHSRVICEKNYINGKHYGNNTVITPCLNKSEDFNTWCRYYNKKSPPDGFNNNSIAAKKILVGKYGDCFNNNGKSDEHKARAICDYNHYDTVLKLSPLDPNLNTINDIFEKDHHQKKNSNKLNNHNEQNMDNLGSSDILDVFTDCYPMETTNFKEKCSELLNTDIKNTVASQIIGYDCNPGFSRARCFTGKQRFRNYNQYNDDDNNNCCDTSSSDTSSSDTLSENISSHNINNLSLNSTNQSSKMIFGNKYKISKNKTDKPKKNKTWIYEKSKNSWITLQKNLIGKWGDLDIDNTNMSVSFWINIEETREKWRNIFHISNQDENCCKVGNRVPGVWIRPNNTNIYVTQDLDKASNQAKNVTNIELGENTLIVLTWKNDNHFCAYVNGELIVDYVYNDYQFKKANYNASFYITDPWYEEHGGFKIKNFKIDKNILSETEIKNMYSLYNNDLDSHNVKNRNHFWVYKKSKNNFINLEKNNLIGKWEITNIHDNREMSISFLIIIKKTSSNWRNIFHISNQNENCCKVGNRVPGFWVSPNNKTQLYLAHDLIDKGNEYIFTNNELELNKIYLVTLTFNKNTYKIYLNNELDVEKTFNSNFETIKNDASFYISDPWYNSSDILIKNFHIYNKVLNKTDINNIYTNNTKNIDKNYLKNENLTNCTLISKKEGTNKSNINPKEAEELCNKMGNKCGGFLFVPEEVQEVRDNQKFTSAYFCKPNTFKKGNHNSESAIGFVKINHHK